MATPKHLLDRHHRPSDLVQLVNSHARLLGAVQQSTEELARLEAGLADMTRRREETASRLASISALARAVAAQIEARYPELDSAATQPVRRISKAYGAYGKLIASIRAALHDAGDDWVSTGAIAERIILEYGLKFATSKHRDAWRRTSIRNRLQRLVEEGEAECWKTPRRVYWRAARSTCPPPSLEALHAQLGND